MKDIKDIISSLTGESALVGFFESICGDKDVAQLLVFILLSVAKRTDKKQIRVI
jgi:hypothetical protein